MTLLGPEVAAQASLAHLMGRLGVVELSVRAAVTRRQRGDPYPSDPLRGVFLSDDYVTWLLDRDHPADGADEVLALRERLERDAEEAEDRGVDVRLRRLSRSFGLSPVEEEILVVALAPTLDRRFGQLCGYLNDDVTRRFATVVLACELARGRDSADPRDLLLLAGHSRLVGLGLVEVVGDDVPLPTRAVRVVDRVVGFLLGDDTAADELGATLLDVAPLPLLDPVLAEHAPQSLVLEQRAGSDAVVEAVTWLHHHGVESLVVRVDDHVDPAALSVAVIREALLAGRAIVLGPLEGTPSPELRRLLAAPLTCVLWSTAPSPDLGVGTVVLEVPGRAHRRRAWQLLAPGLPDADADVLAQHRVGAGTARRAVSAAHADARDHPNAAALGGALRAQDGGMGKHARRIRAVRGWPDLVLPAPTTRTLRELVGMVRHRDDIVDTWGLGRAGGGRGVLALFAGPSGTGKTLAAEVVAKELGVDLFTVDLARVVDKYVGETEKNLDRVLAAAEGVTGVVFFDEADALFGRRGDVRNGQDRYANLEVSYLLQRVEDVGAVVVLATNLRSHVDEAFVRRLDAVVEFPQPDPSARERIWRHHLARVPVDEVDVGFCAGRFDLSGGNIRNVVVAASCLAADDGRGVTMADVVRGLEREQAKLGRLHVTTDYGEYAGLLDKEVTV